MLAGLKARLELSEDDRLLAVRDRLEQAADPTHELASLAQRYGAPKRMLDWTESPYVAAFFALSGVPLLSGPQEPEDDSCCVLVLDTLASAWNSDAGVELVRADRRTNARLRHQRGVFTLNASTSSTLEEYCRAFYAHTPADVPALGRIVMPAAVATTGLRELEMTGITSESLFPGIEGAARCAFVRAVDRHVLR